MPEDRATKIAQVKAISLQIIPLLSGEDPDIVGGVLGEMVGIYFASHNPAIREQVREAFDTMVDQVVATVDAKTGKWRKQ